jgi:hypothetical protein
MNQAAQISRSDIQKERRDYKMPEVHQGMPVVWYRYNSPDNRGQLGFVQIVHGRQRHIDVIVPFDALGEMKEAVYHVSDPILKLGREAAEGGCWEYSDETLYVRRAVAGMEARIAKIEKAQTSGTTAAVRKDLQEVKATLKRLDLPEIKEPDSKK